jgi:hypothetical protein
MGNFPVLFIKIWHIKVGYILPIESAQYFLISEV